MIRRLVNKNSIPYKEGSVFKSKLFSLIFFIVFLFIATVAHAQPFAYITNAGSNTISVIDTATNTVTATIPVGTNPRGVAVNPTGTMVYVANYDSNTISVIDTATNTVTATIPVGTWPLGIAVNHTGTTVYVANNWSHNVSVVDTATNTVTSTIPMDDSPYGVAVNHTDTSVYVSEYFPSNNNVSVIDTATNTVTATIPVGTSPTGVAINPTSTTVYVANFSSNTISVIDTATNTVTATIPVGTNPNGVAVNPIGTIVYVANHNSNTISVINTATNTVTATIPVGTSPTGVAINPTGTTVYVANFSSNTISVIDTATNTVTANVPVGNNPVAFGKFIIPFIYTPILNPDNGHYYQIITVAGPGLTWYEAVEAAALMQFDGMIGHLATITSPQEENFLQNTFPISEPSVWLGAYEYPVSRRSSHSGNWIWITREPWSYTDWAPGEPDIAGVYKTCLEFGEGVLQWNDEDCYSLRNYYLLEYEGGSRRQGRR